MLHADESRVGASFLSKRAVANPRELIISLIEKNPGASKDELFKLFRDEIRNEPDYQHAVDWYCFINMYSYSESSRNGARMIEQREVREKKIAEASKEVASQILLLNMEMPNGKRLRYCTGNYVAKTYGRLASAGKKAGNKLMGQVFDEKSLREYLK